MNNNKKETNREKSNRARKLAIQAINELYKIDFKKLYHEDFRGILDFGRNFDKYKDHLFHYSLIMEVIPIPFPETPYHPDNCKLLLDVLVDPNTEEVTVIEHQPPPWVP